MNLHDALLSRRTIQRFEPGVVPDEVLERALRAATFAPNHKLTWPWRFTLPGPVTRSALAELYVQIKSGGRACSPEQLAILRAKVLDPDRLVVVSQRLSPDPHRSQEDYATCAIAIHNLALSLHADGYGSKWSSGALTTHPEACALLGLDPKQESVVGFVWVGRPGIVPHPAPRPGWEEVSRTLP